MSRVVVYLALACVGSWLLEGLLWIRVGFALWQNEPTWQIALTLIAAAFVFLVGAFAWEMLSRRL